MKRLGCLLNGCLGLGAALAVLIVLTLVFMAQYPPPTGLVAVPPVTLTPVIPIPSATATDDAGGGIVLVTAQMAGNTPRPTALTQPLSTATPPVPAAAPFFSSQTAAAQQSATVMWNARTAWFGALTQGAIDHAATLQTLGTPER